VLARNSIRPEQFDSQVFQITVLTPNETFISNVYVALLERPADAGGLAYYTAGLEQGVSTTQVVLNIENAPSNEFRSDEVNRLYELHLHRSALADTVGLNHWVADLRQGITLEQVSAAIVNSPEYIQKRTDGSFNSWLDAFYSDEFHRAVDATGRAGWDKAFASGQSREQIAEAIFTAPSLAGQSGNEYQIDLVDTYYEQFLGRSSKGDSGADIWLSELQHGTRDEAVIAGILGSSEFYNK
jgi:hypothetical protein